MATPAPGPAPHGTPSAGFTAIVERGGEWFIAYSPEIPGANCQGCSKDEALASLSEAIALILHDRREDGLRGLPPDAVRETVVVR
jgi:predicted RNase H-like HicB family nuclease